MFSNKINLVPRTGLEPVSLTAADFKSAVYTSSTTRAGGGLSHGCLPAHSMFSSHSDSQDENSPIRFRETFGSIDIWPGACFFETCRTISGNTTP